VQDAAKIANVAADTAQRAALAGAKVNSACGFHVHMGLPAAVSRGSLQRHDIYEPVHYTRNRLYKFAKHFEEYFFDIVPRSRKGNIYCERLQDVNSMLCHHAWFSVSYSVPTVELRIHGGTVNPWKVKGWVEVCIRMRQMINAAILNEEGWDNLPSRKFVDYLEPGTLGSKYLLARECAGGKLVDFGF
jgi:hypothetical protein